MTTKQADLFSSLRTFYSKELIESSLPNLVFFALATYNQDLTVEKNSAIEFTKFADIGEGSELTEGSEIQTEKLADSTVKLTVKEYGKAVAVTEKALQTNPVSLFKVQTKKLSKSYVRTVDLLLRDVVLATSNVIYGAGKAAANLLVAGDIFDADMVDAGVLALENAEAPKFNNEFYVCVATPYQLSTLKKDSRWENVNMYNLNGRNIFKGEAGMFNGVVFISTTQMPTNTAAESLAKYGCNVITHEAVFLGENGFGFADALPVEIRDDGTKDFGRNHPLAWYALFGVGLIEEQNVVKGLTAIDN